MSGNLPWRDGFWIVEEMASTIFEVEGEKWLVKNLIALDYPDVESSMPPSRMKYGDFGAASKEMAEATGQEKYNIEIVWYWGDNKMPGYVNDAGTKIHFWNEISKKTQAITWLSPEEMAKIREDRDDINAPR